MRASAADEPIASPFIREYFQWDRMSDVRWDVVASRLRAANLILAAPERFPNADQESVQQSATELELFLLGRPVHLGGPVL